MSETKTYVVMTCQTHSFHDGRRTVDSVIVRWEDYNDPLAALLEEAEHDEDIVITFRVLEMTDEEFKEYCMTDEEYKEYCKENEVDLGD